MKHYRTDKTACKLLQLAALLMTALILCAAYFLISRFPIVMWSTILICGMMGIFFSAVYLPLWFRVLEYIVDSGCVIKHSGLWIRRQQSIRIQSVQYRQTVRTPFSQKTGLNFLILYALGGVMTIPFLSCIDLEALQNQLEQNHDA